jgi:hypothetical protein
MMEINNLQCSLGRMCHCQWKFPESLFGKMAYIRGPVCCFSCSSCWCNFPHWYSDIWMLIVSSLRSFLMFTKIWMFSFRKCSSSLMGWTTCNKCNFRCPAVGILVMLSPELASVDVRAADGLGHHILPVSIHAITFYRGVWKTMCTETTLTQWMNLEKKFHLLNQCRHSKQSCCQFFNIDNEWMPMVHILKAFSIDKLFSQVCCAN